MISIIDIIGGFVAKTEQDKLLDDLLKDIAKALKKKKKDITAEEFFRCITAAVQPDHKVIKKASEMSRQKKQQRLVINMPEWLKERLMKLSHRKKISMNEIIRQALTEYLLEQETVE